MTFNRSVSIYAAIVLLWTCKETPSPQFFASKAHEKLLQDIQSKTEPKSGCYHGPTGPVEVQYRIIGTKEMQKAMFGDTVVPLHQIRKSCEEQSGLNLASVSVNTMLWPTGEIPYSIHGSVPKDLHEAIHEGAKAWEFDKAGLPTGWKMIPASEEHLDKVVVLCDPNMEFNTAWASIGRQGVLNLSCVVLVLATILLLLVMSLAMQ